VADLGKISFAAQQWLDLIEPYLLAGQAAKPGEGSPPESEAAARPDRTPAHLSAIQPLARFARWWLIDQPSRELLAAACTGRFRVATAADAQEALRWWEPGV